MNMFELPRYVCTFNNHRVLVKDTYEYYASAGLAHIYMIYVPTKISAVYKVATVKTFLSAKEPVIMICAINMKTTCYIYDCKELERNDTKRIRNIANIVNDYERYQRNKNIMTDQEAKEIYDKKHKNKKKNVLSELASYAI